MAAVDPMFANHLAFLGTHRGRVASWSDDWVAFHGDAPFLSFGSPQSERPIGTPLNGAAVWVYPWSGEGWTPRLRDQGFGPAERLTYMALRQGRVPTRDVPAGEIRTVESDEAALDFAAVQQAGFVAPDSPNADWWRTTFPQAALHNYARPEQRFFIFYSEGQPAGVLLSVRTGSTVGIYAVATDPRFRGRGISSALLAHCASDAGAVIVLQVLEGSYAQGFYTRLGFEERYRMQVWRRP